MALIYCIEDDPGITELIECAMKAGGNEVACFSQGKSFFASLTRLPDLLLLDIMLPDEDGYAILRRIRADEALQNIPVIMLTARSSEVDKVAAFEAGADDYLTKPFGVMELLSRIKAVLRRCGGTKHIRTVNIGKLMIDLPGRKVVYDGNEVILTYKEFEILSMLVQNRTIVVTREQLLERVWGYEYEGESRTLDMHIKTLRQKLEQVGCAGVIQTIRGVGYKIHEVENS